MPTEKGKSPKAAKEPAIALPETTPEQIEALAKNILVSEFSIEEDILFLRAQQGHGLTIRELPKKYADKKKQQPKSFLHECKAEVFRERLLQMPEDKPRARLLEMELQRQLAMEAEAKADVVEVSAAVVPPLLLQLSSVSHPPIRGHKRNIEQGCEEVASLVQRRLERTKDGTPLLTIDDTNQKYKELNEFACLDPAVLSKLAAFSISPKCVLDAEDMQALVHSSTAHITGLASAVIERLDDARAAKVDEVHELREHEMRAMKRQLEEDFEREIAKARARMNANIEALSKDISNKWDRVMGAMETHFAVETQEVSKVREVLLEYSLNDKNDKLAVLKKAADEIFVPAATMKLALLGKVWGYDTLYESCRVRIIADPLSHASSPLWKSQLLIAGLTTEVLAALPAPTVIAMDELQQPQIKRNKAAVSRLEGKHEQRAEAAPQGQLLPRIIGIMSDVDVCMSGHVPPQVALAEWSSMDNLQLREVLEKGPILFQEEFAQVVEGRRSGAISDKAVIDASLAAPGLFINERQLSASSRAARQPLLLHCTPFIQFGGWGRYYFEVAIDCLDHEFGANIAVGLDVLKSADAVRDALVPGFVGNDAGVFGCALQNDGIIYRQGSCEMYPATFKQGDVVGVAVDVQLGSISFYINNTPVVRESDADAAAKKGKGKFVSAYLISSPGTTRFRPAVYMYSPRAAKLAQVSCDFTLVGGVPVPQHEPMSRYG